MAISITEPWHQQEIIGLHKQTFHYFMLMVKFSPALE